MNKATKVILILSLTMIIAGTAITGVGLAMGGTININYILSNGSIHIGNNETVSKTISLNEFDKIDIQTSVTDINIVNGDSYSLFYNVREEFIPNINNSNGTLTISTTNNNTGFSFFNFGTGEEEYITITIPSKNSITDIQIEGSTADIHINDLYITGNIVLSTGDITLNNVTGDHLNFITSTGDKKINKCTINELKLKASTGDNKINNSNITTIISNSSTGEFKIAGSRADYITITASTGDVEMDLDGRVKDYDYDIDTNTGDIIIGNNEYKKNYSREEDSEKRIDVHTSTGDIKINFDSISE